LIAVIVILALTVLAIVIIDFAKRDCSDNQDCSKTAYCGSDFKCHDFPSEIVVKENNYTIAAVVLGIALIVAAYIFRGGKIPYLKN